MILIWWKNGKLTGNVFVPRHRLIMLGIPRRSRLVDPDYSRDIAAINQRFWLPVQPSLARGLYFWNRDPIPLISPAKVPILYRIKLMRYTETHSTSGLEFRRAVPPPSPQTPQLARSLNVMGSWIGGTALCASMNFNTYPWAAYALVIYAFPTPTFDRVRESVMVSI